MLDLTKQKKFYEIKWFDGTVLHLPLPTQEFLVSVVNLEETQDTVKQIQGLAALLKDILKKNQEGKEFTEEDFAQLDLQTIQLIMEDYVSFVYKQLGE